MGETTCVAKFTELFCGSRITGCMKLLALTASAAHQQPQDLVLKAGCP